jgi:hypothetical protein
VPQWSSCPTTTIRNVNTPRRTPSLSKGRCRGAAGSCGGLPEKGDVSDWIREREEEGKDHGVDPRDPGVPRFDGSRGFCPRFCSPYRDGRAAVIPACTSLARPLSPSTS